MNAAPSVAQTVTVGPFLQDIATFTNRATGLPSQRVQALAWSSRGVLYAGTDQGLARCDSGVWNAVAKTPESSVRGIQGMLDGSLYVTTVQEPYHLCIDGSVEFLDFNPTGQNVLAFGVLGTEIRFALTPHTLIDGKTRASVVLPDGVTARALALNAQGTVLIATDQGLFGFENGQVHAIPLQSSPTNHPGRLLSPDMRDVLADEQGGFWIATAQGLN